MKLSDFILLTEEQKKLTLLHEGVLIAKRKNNNYLLFLFQLKNYYVEAHCNSLNKRIEEYSVFDNTKTLNPYLDAISIEGVLK